MSLERMVFAAVMAALAVAALAAAAAAALATALEALVIGGLLYAGYRAWIAARDRDRDRAAVLDPGDLAAEIAALNARLMALHDHLHDHLHGLPCSQVDQRPALRRIDGRSRTP